MGETTVQGIPYPAGTDDCDVPGDIQAVADRLEAILSGGIRSSGKSIIAAEQSRTNAAYDYLGTPDKVTGIVMPTDGLLFVAFQALWKESVANAARAAIFLGANQLKARWESLGSAPPGGTQPEVTPAEALINDAGVDHPLATWSRGLTGGTSAGREQHSDVTTGQVVGNLDKEGVCAIFAAAGTYDVGVKFKASSGSVTAKERKLWVWSMDFGLPLP
jgi:hypothetical protein